MTKLQWFCQIKESCLHCKRAMQQNYNASIISMEPYTQKMHVATKLEFKHQSHLHNATKLESSRDN